MQWLMEEGHSHCFGMVSIDLLAVWDDKTLSKRERNLIVQLSLFAYCSLCQHKLLFNYSNGLFSTANCWIVSIMSDNFFLSPTLSTVLIMDTEADTKALQSFKDLTHSFESGVLEQGNMGKHAGRCALRTRVGKHWSIITQFSALTHC